MNSLVEVVSLTNDVTTTNDPCSAPHCPSHSERECELYCQDCSKLICYQCIAKWGNCHEHLYQDVQEIAKGFRKTVKEFSQRGEQFLPTVEQHLGLLEDLKAKQVANVAEVCGRMADTFDRHIKGLKQRKEELVQVVFTFVRQNNEGLHGELDRVQMEQAKLANVVEFCSKMLTINNPALFVQKYCEAKDKVFGLELPELVSHLEISNVRFEGNDSLLRDVISNYGSVVKSDKDKAEEEKAQETQHDEKTKTMVDNSGKMHQEGSQLQPKKVRVTVSNGAQRGSGMGAAGMDSPSLAIPVREASSGGSAVIARNTSNHPVLWKLCQKNHGSFVFIDNKRLSVQPRGTEFSSVIGIPGFQGGKHSWKVKLENLGAGVGIGVCLGRNMPGLCVTLEKQHTRFALSTMVTVELDCETKRVKVKPACQLSNTIAYQSPIQSVHPYFLLPPGNRQGKISVIEMDGKSLEDGKACCLL